MKPESISEQMMFNTVRLETASGTGTGFFYNFVVGEATYPAIITNKHVVNYKQDENVKFHLHLQDGDGESNSSIGIELNAHWYFHSTKDICFTFVNPVFEQVKASCGKKVFYIADDAGILATDEKIKDLSALEELVMVGYPIGLADARNNYPIFRKGYTAAHPAVDFNEDGIGLVDMACFPGSSGSPIYILNEGSYRDKHGNSYFGSSRVMLLGVLFAGPQYDARGDIVVKTIPTSTQIVESSTRVMTNLGYYVKAAEINEFQKFIEESVANGSMDVTTQFCILVPKINLVALDSNSLSSLLNIWEESKVKRERMKSKATLYKYVGMNGENPLKYIKPTIEFSHIWMDSGSNFNDPFDVAYTQSHSLRKVPGLHVLCLTNSYGKKLMWSHYASNHTGICYTIEVDRDLVYPVCYTTKRVVIEKDDPEDADAKQVRRLDEILKNNKAKPKRNLVKSYDGLSIAKKIALVKDSKWIDEREYRIVLDDGDKDLMDIEDDKYYFNGIRITNIYLGTRFVENKKAVQDELLDLCRKFHISVKQMEYGAEKYEVKTGKTIL